MTIHLPNDLESSLRATVQSGRFASVDEAMAEAVHLLLSELDQIERPKLSDSENDLGPDLVLGCMRDDTELMDEIVADANRHRQDETWRELDL
jgi:Arc/MetJ-type ribon-helix-helix transcriptional regulator